MSEGLVSVDLRDAPLTAVLRSIAEQSGIRMKVDDDIQARVTQTFANVPLEEGLRRLTQGHSIVVVSGRRGKTGPPEPVEVRVYAASPVDRARDRIAARQTAGQRAQEIRRLAQTSGEAAAGEIARTLATDPEPQVRGEAASALGTVGGEISLAALIRAASDVAVAVRLRVTTALGRFKDERARAALDQMSRADTDPQVRKRAASVLSTWAR